MKPIIYQVLPRLFGNNGKGEPVANGTLQQNGTGKFGNFTPEVLRSLKEFGYTHIWYTGVLDHATRTDYSEIGQPGNNPAIVKGMAGSPYAIRDYYNVDADLAENPENRFMEYTDLIERTHKAGLKVIMDFIPNHVARNYHSVSAPEGVLDFGADDKTDYHFWPNNNFYYCVNESFSPRFDRQGYIEYPARATGNDCFSASPSENDWYETVKLNYGVDYCGGMAKHFNPIPDTWHKMVEILEFWVSYGIDGFRCDMAEMVPVEFWHWATERIKALNPDVIFIAEVYNPNLYRNYIRHGGFDYLYDKVGLYDTLRPIITGNAPASSITYAWQSVQDIKNHMLNFMENHDEQRICSDFFAYDGNHRKAALRGLLGTTVAALISSCPIMIYAGQEVGERGMESEGFSGCDGRTSIFDYWRVGSLCRLQKHFDTGKALPEDEKEITDRYRNLLATANSDVAQRGELYDLMWLNNRNPGFDYFGCYAFLRHTDKDVMLVTVNFTDHDTILDINITDHVLNALDMEPIDEARAVDTLTEERCSFAFTAARKAQVAVKALTARCLLFKKRDVK